MIVILHMLMRLLNIALISTSTFRSSPRIEMKVVESYLCAIAKEVGNLAAFALCRSKVLQATIA